MVRAAIVEQFPEHVDLLDAGCDKVIDDHFCYVHGGIRPGVPLEEQEPHDLRWIREDFLGHDLPFERTIVHGHTPTDSCFPDRSVTVSASTLGPITVVAWLRRASAATASKRLPCRKGWSADGCARRPSGNQSSAESRHLIATAFDVSGDQPNRAGDPRCHRSRNIPGPSKFGWPSATSIGMLFGDRRPTRMSLARQECCSPHMARVVERQ